VTRAELRERPLVAVPARFSASASALRYQAEVAARALVEAVFRAGGEPVVLHPHAPDGVADDDDVAARLEPFDAVLLPGGGDLAPHWYAGAEHPSLYDVDVEQDAFDLAVARWAWVSGRPLLAVCRGLQVLNVSRGGTLLPDMPRYHRHLVSDLQLDPASGVGAAVGTTRLAISCYHHQALDRLGDGLVATARAEDGTVEAVERDGHGPGWFLGVQWHPEDTAATDPAQQALFDAFVAAAPARRRQQVPLPARGAGA
jgi:putative glutamine amidotransferase